MRWLAWRRRVLPRKPPPRKHQRREAPTLALLLCLAAIGEEARVALGRTGADRRLVGYAAPSRPIRHDEMAVLEHGRMIDKLVVPGEAVDVGFHDAKVGHGGGKVRIHHGAQMPVEVMRRHIDLVRLGGARNFHGLPHAVPGCVDDGHIHRLLAEIGQEFAQAKERLAGRDRVPALAANEAQRLWIEGVDLDPKHIEIGDGAQNLEIAFGLGVEVEIEQQVDVRSRTLADRFQMHAQVAQHVSVDVELRQKRHAKTGPPALGVFAARRVEKDVGLERGELLLPHLAADGLDALQVGDGGLKEARVIDAPGGAVGPVDADAITYLAAEQLIAGHVERLGLGVEERVLDGTDGLGHHAAGARSGGAVKLRVDALVLAGPLPDHNGGQALDHGAHPRRAKPLIELAPAHDACLGGELDEVIVAPACIAGERLDVDDLHRRFSPAATGKPSTGARSPAAAAAARLPTSKQGSAGFPQSVRSSSPSFAISPAQAPARPFWRGQSGRRLAMRGQLGLRDRRDGGKAGVSHRSRNKTPHAAMACRQDMRDAMAIAELSHERVSNPVDLVEDIAGRNDWATERTSTDELTLTVAGQWADYHVSLNWRDDLETLHIACAFDAKVPDNRLPEVYRLVAQINEQLWLGHFDVWLNEGLIMYRQGLMLNGALATPHQCEALLKAAFEACERYYQAFQFVVWAGKESREALASTMFETEGQA